MVYRTIVSILVDGVGDFVFSLCGEYAMYMFGSLDIWMGDRLRSLA